MAIYDAGYLSPIKNKLGNAVGRRWRNLNVLAVYNGNPRNPRTTSQQNQRKRFSAVTELAAAFALASVKGLSKACEGQKVFPRALFIKKNFLAVTLDGGGSVTVEYTKLVMSQGGCAEASFGVPAFDTPLTVEFTLAAGNCAVYPAAVQRDIKVTTVVYCPEIGQAVVSDSVGISAASVAVEVPASWNGARVHVYAFTQYIGEDVNDWALQRNECSRSSYLGAGTIG